MLIRSYWILTASGENGTELPSYAR